mgnify:CR=1 FL=1
MKNLLLTLLFIFPITAIAQQKNDLEISQYLQKSKTQSKTGNILLITGGGLIATGVLVAISGEKKGGYYFFSKNDLIYEIILSQKTPYPVAAVIAFESESINEFIEKSNQEISKLKKR